MDGSGSWTGGGLEGLIKTVVIHSVLQWFMSAVGTNLAHGLWKSIELRTEAHTGHSWWHRASRLVTTTEIGFTEVE